MRQEGVSMTPVRERRERRWVDFGVDEGWEQAPARRRHAMATPPSDRSARVEAEPGRLEAAVSRQAAGHADDEAWGDPDLRPAPMAGRRALAPVSAPTPRHARPSSARRGDRTVAPVAAAHVPKSPAAARRSGIARDAANGLDRPDSLPPSSAHAAPAGRRTVTIRGRGAERDLAFPAYDRARRTSTPRHERPGFRPERTALWAVFLGLLLVLVAAMSAHAAVPRHFAHASPRAAVIAASPAPALIRAHTAR